MFIQAPGFFEHSKVEAQETEEAAKRKLPQLDAGAWALVDAETGVYLAGKNPDKRLPVASTTNVMTALMTFEEETDLDEEVTISAQAERFVGYTYSNVGLIKGEHLSMRELLVAALIPSGTEAVYALAEYLGGGGGEAGVERFVQRMNEKAKSMGLKNTHFENPAGLDASGHYSSARDLATITRKAMEYRAFADIVDTEQTTISTQNRVIDVFNTNDLLYGYKKANGVKTGASPEGGFSLVASATSGDESYVAVVLEAESEEYRSEAAREALEHGFDGYDRRPLVDEGQVYSEARLPYRQQQSVELIAATDVLGPAGPGLEVERRVRVGEPPMAAKADQELGTVKVLVNGQRIGSTTLVTKRGYNEASLWTRARYAVAWPVSRVLSALAGRTHDEAGGEVRGPPGGRAAQGVFSGVALGAGLRFIVCTGRRRLLEDGVSERSPLENETELLAWAVLRASNRTQAKGTTVRLVVPRAPEVIEDLDMEVGEERLVEVEEWLVDRGYLAPADVMLTRGTYTITPVGLEWLRGEMPELLEATRRVTEDAPDARPSSGSADAPAASERVAWWRRVLGR